MRKQQILAFERLEQSNINSYGLKVLKEKDIQQVTFGIC